MQEKNWEQEKQEWEQEKQREELAYAVHISNIKKIREITSMQNEYYKRDQYYKNLATKQCSEEISKLKLELMEKIALYTEKLNKLEKVKKIL